jgi:hypothetical protein
VAAAGVTGCASKEPTSAAAAASSTGPVTSNGPTTSLAAASDGDIALHALTSEQTTLAVYRQLARRTPAAAKSIAPLIAVQRRHVDALVSALGLDQPPSTPTVDVVATPVDVAIPETANHAARVRLADCRRSASGSLSSMFASMAAAHEVVASQWTAE